MRTICLMNQKGGVGKTTTTANLGAALALKGSRVLLVDCDAQFNLSLHFGIDVNRLDKTLYDVFTTPLAMERIVVGTATPLLDLVPSHIDLSGVELELASEVGRERILEEKLAALAGSGYDFVLIDCPPSLGLLSLNALVASREVFIPLQTEFFALQGMTKLLQVVEMVRRRINPALEVTGILPCMVDGRTNLAKEVLEQISSHFGDRVFSTTIRENVSLAEAPSHRKTIFEYAPRSSGAKDYEALAVEVLAMGAGGAQPRGSAPAPVVVAGGAAPPEETSRIARETSP